jgi:tetratricopeptide (TPR) repeat protein
MSMPAEDRLLRRLLERTDSVGAEHPSDEQLALLAGAELTADERAAVAAHVADCAQCRQLVVYLLRDDNHEPLAVANDRPTGASSAKTWTWFALAAAVLVAAGLGYAQWGMRPRGAGEILLARAGCLTDFGYELDGTVARELPTPGASAGPPDAPQAVDPRDAASLLNHGYELLRQGDPNAALLEFQRAARLAPRDEMPQLGAGLAHFFQGQLNEAEAAFRQACVQAPGNIDTRVNLAMTLDEQGNTEEATAVWRDVLALPLGAEMRANIEKLLASRASTHEGAP